MRGFGRRLPRRFFARESVAVARDLIGCALFVDGVGGLITETEAYDGRTDEACHAFRGRTPRCESLFGRPGTLYVYRIHQSRCMNLATVREGIGSGVLLRGIQPLQGLATIHERRGGKPRKSWCDGPGKLTRALAVELDDDGTDTCAPGSRIRVYPRPLAVPDEAILATPRIGISRAVELPWRFVPRPEELARWTA